MEAAGLAFSIVNLIPTCVEGFKLVTAVRRFSEQGRRLYWKLKTQELRFHVWTELSEFPIHGSTNQDQNRTLGLESQTASSHHPRILELIEGILKEMMESIADSDKLMSQYGFDALESDSIDFTTIPRRKIDKIRWALHDKKALEELIDDLKGFNDGLLETLSIGAQRTARFNVTTRLASSAVANEDLQAIQDGAPQDDTLSNTAAFKAFNLSLEDQNATTFSHEIAMNELIFPEEGPENDP